jgi:hypothetical protein
MKLQYAAFPLLGALSLVAGCSGSSGLPTARTTPRPLTATAVPTPSATSKAPAVLPKRTPTPAPSTVYVTPQPNRTVYVLPTPAPTTYLAPNTDGDQSNGLGGFNVYPINSEGSLVNVRMNPSAVSGVVGTLSQDQYVHIVCTQYGDAVTGPWGTTTLWDSIDSPYTGYVSDEWVNTSTGAPVVGTC